MIAKLVLLQFFPLPLLLAFICPRENNAQMWAEQAEDLLTSNLQQRIIICFCSLGQNSAFSVFPLQGTSERNGRVATKRLLIALVEHESQAIPDQKEAAVSVLQKLVNNPHVGIKEVCKVT